MAAIVKTPSRRKVLIVAKSIAQKISRTMETLAADCRRHEVSGLRPYSEMPGPPPIPVLGNNWRFIPYIGDFDIHQIDQVSLRLHRQYGDFVKIEGLLNRPDMVFVYDANEIERIFRQEEKMPHRPSMPSLDYYKHVLRKDIFEQNPGVLAVHGEGWYNFRSKVQQVMLQPRTAKMYTSAIEEASDAFIHRINQIKDKNDDVPDDFMNEVHKWSLESIANVALDRRLGCLDSHAPRETQDLIDAILVFFKNVAILELKIPFWKLFSTPTWRDYVNALDTILRITMKYTTEALDRAKYKNVNDKDMSLLERVLAVEGDAKVASVLGLDLFLVGIDTTSKSVSSILYQLAQHPEKQEILYDEIRRCLPPSNGVDPIEADHLDQLKYLKGCIRETLRMYPVVLGNGRCVTNDETSVGGYHVPKGVHIVFQHYVTGNKEKYFPRSQEFLPERWLGAGDGVRHAFASLPFGYGRRMCIGRRFADLEMMMVICKIIQSFKVEYHYEKLDYYIDPMYTPKGPLKLRFVDRTRDRTHEKFL